MSLKARMEEYVAIAKRGVREDCIERVAGSTRQVSGLYSEAKFGNFTFAIDEPEEFGGTEKEPNPAEVMLAALAASIEVTCRVYADYLEVPVEKISVELEGTLDIRGIFATDPAYRPGFESIDITLRIVSGAGTEKLDDLVKRVEACCPILDAVRGTTPVDMRAHVEVAATGPTAG